MDIFESTPIEEIRKEFVYHHQPPVFDEEIFKYQMKITNNEEADPNRMKKVYVDTFDKWIHASKLNQIAGLDKFEHRDFCVGVTGFIDDLYVCYGEKIRYLEREYSYHWRLGRGTKVSSYKELKKDEHLIISSPFCYYADIHPEMNDILDFCDENQVHVHVDSAWYGCATGFKLNYDRPCIKSVGFSLSKGLSAGHNRMGIRFARTREPGPITIVNDFNMGVVQLMWMGVKLMNQFPSDFLHNKYDAAYSLLCQKLNLKPSKAIHIAFGPYPGGGSYEPVGISRILTKMV